ncbi:MAG: hypothetical protein NTX49_05390 [Chlamydiae bacterium]|nr:hypothetical protein [Chlamydiota bacterium]
MSAVMPTGAGAPLAPILRETSEYLSRDNMHFRPVSARVFHLINYSANELFYAAKERPTFEVPLKALAYATSYTGMTLNSVVALVEAAATGAIAIVATIIHIATGAQSEFLQKYTLKCWSYSFNCSSVLITQVFFLAHGLATKYHLADAAILNVQSLTSSVVAHLVLGSMFNNIAGRTVSVAYTTNFLTDAFRTAAVDLLQAARDDRLIAADRPGAPGNDFFTRFPQHRQTVQRFFNRQAGDAQVTPEERSIQLQAAVRDFMQHLGIAAPVAGAPDAAGIIPLGNNFTGAETAYQQKLERLVKDASTQVYRNDDLVRHLCEDAAAANPVQGGRDAIDGFFPEIYIPLANYAQLVELEGEITCPQRFSVGALAQYNARHAALLEAKRNLEALSPSEKALLIRKLLNSSINIEGVSADRKAAIQLVSNQIGALSGALHQGSLMSQMVLNINNPGQLVTGTNLFQRAIQAAGAERAAADA